MPKTPDSLGIQYGGPVLTGQRSVQEQQRYEATIAFNGAPAIGPHSWEHDRAIEAYWKRVDERIEAKKREAARRANATPPSPLRQLLDSL